MAEPQKFSFGSGTPTSSASTGSSLFGTTSNSGSTGLFGNSTGTPSFSFASFGQTPQSSGEEKKSLFSTASATNTGNLFGQKSDAASPFGGFGGQKKEGEMGTPSASPFGALGGVQTPAKTTAAGTPGTTQTQPHFGASIGGSAFVSTTPAAAPGSVLFGAQSTTPAGPPPASTGFGASTGSKSFFGAKPLSTELAASSVNSDPNSNVGPFKPPQPASSNASFPSTTPFSTFTGSSTGITPATSTKPEAPKPIFGAATVQPNPSAILFGKQPSQTQPTSNLFGVNLSTAQSAPAKLSGGPTTSQPTPLFTPTTTTTTTTPKPTFTFPPSTSNSTPATIAAAETGASKPLFATVPSSQSSSTPLTTSGLLFTTLGGTSSATTSQAAPSPFSAPSTTSAPTRPAAPATTAAITSTTTAPTTTGLGTSALGASTSGPAPPSQSRLRNKTMDEILTRWASDLTKYTKEFKSQAEVVAQWDQILVDNMDKISKLYAETATSEKQTASVEMQLTAVESQQNELDGWLTKYEHEVDEILAKSGPNPAEVGGPDQERERTFKLAERLSERLEDMSKDLENMIEEVNSANTSLSKSTKADEPITQIVRILNSHLTQLQAIDQGTVALQAKISVAQKNAQGLGYMNGGGSSAAAVEDFYKSYRLGR